MAKTKIKKCPTCGGRLVGRPADSYAIKPATASDNYIWQCEGKCMLNIFNSSLDEIDVTLDWMGKEAKQRRRKKKWGLF